MTLAGSDTRSRVKRMASASVSSFLKAALAAPSSWTSSVSLRRLGFGSFLSDLRSLVRYLSNL